MLSEPTPENLLADDDSVSADEKVRLFLDETIGHFVRYVLGMLLVDTVVQTAKWFSSRLKRRSGI
jgi:hypothetical protein